MTIKHLLCFSAATLLTVTTFPVVAIDFDKGELAKIQRSVRGDAGNDMRQLRLPNNKCLDIAGDPAANGTNVHIWDCHDGANQKWRMDEQGRFVSTAGKCLDAGGDMNANGTNLHLWDCHDGPNQKWRFDNGRLALENNKCIDITGDMNNNGSNAHLWDCHDGPNQKFQF